MTIVGIVKGSGMIMPDMATMLGFIFTDAVVSAGLWQQMLQAAVAPTFNSITVDSDTSTSDTVLAFATGGAGHPVLTSMDDAGADALTAALADVCRRFAFEPLPQAALAGRVAQVVDNGLGMTLDDYFKSLEARA